MLNKDEFEKDEIQERVIKRYGVKLGIKIISAANTIHMNATKMTYQKAVDKAIEWVEYKFTREELDDLKD